ncbi:MAG: glycosyltransferase family 4 protein [Candidatus Sabulitectum sp.]|nr:glycosyltransferase family 4 protein [Candidatus Sabulitectum sp.]
MKKIAVFHMLPSGGGIRVLRQFVEGLSPDFDLHIHQPEGASSATNISAVEETVYPYPMWKKPRGYLRPVAPLFLILRLLSFKRVCRRVADNINRTADAVLVHNAMPVAAPPILQFLNIPSAYFCYEYPRHIFEKDIIQRTKSLPARLALLPLERLEKCIDRKSTLNADKIITFSNYMQQRIRDIYNRDSVIVRPGIDDSFFSPSPATGKENSVLSVGALWPFKGHETAIRIIGLIQPEIRPNLHIVADREYPGYRMQLVSLAQDLSVKVTIHLNISDIELRELYRRAKTVLCCQRQEPYGLVPLESMACGTPVIALREGGFVDNIIHRRNGFLFDGSAEKGAELLFQLLSDKASIRKMTISGRKFIKQERSIAMGTNKLGEILESL